MGCGMILTDRQNLIRDRISTAVISSSTAEIVYCSEWLGYLPFGLYQWIECNQEDISRDFPSGWEGEDLAALETCGFLEKIGEWQDPQDDMNRKTTFKVHIEQLKA